MRDGEDSMREAVGEAPRWMGGSGVLNSESMEGRVRLDTGGCEEGGSSEGRRDERGRDGCRERGREAGREGREGREGGRGARGGGREKVWREAGHSRGGRCGMACPRRRAATEKQTFHVEKEPLGFVSEGRREAYEAGVCAYLPRRD